MGEAKPVYTPISFATKLIPDQSDSEGDAEETSEFPYREPMESVELYCRDRSVKRLLARWTYLSQLRNN